MEYTIKQIAKRIEISEQGLYKRIASHKDEYMQKGFVVLNQVEQPNGTTKEQTFITDSGLEYLLQAKRLRTTDIDTHSTEVEQPLNQGLSNHSTEVEQPTTQPSTQNDSNTASNQFFNQLNQVLNQQIEDLKAENKRLVEKLEAQEQKFDIKYEQQEIKFREQFEQQREDYKNSLSLITSKFNLILQRLPEPQEDIVQPTEITAEQPQEHRGFFSRLFGHK